MVSLLRPAASTLKFRTSGSHQPTCLPKYLSPIDLAILPKVPGHQMSDVASSQVGVPRRPRPISTDAHQRPRGRVRGTRGAGGSSSGGGSGAGDAGWIGWAQLEMLIWTSFMSFD